MTDLPYEARHQVEIPVTAGEACPALEQAFPSAEREALARIYPALEPA